MNLSWIDWTIVAVLFAALNMTGYICNRYSKGVADFLVAGRSVGRYLGVGSDAMSGLAAVTILAIWQMCYQAGIAGNWWYLMKFPLAIILALTGWGIYRFRQTRAMTIPQYLEMRYSKKFRIFAGVLAYVAGILNMGIFPIIGASFFVYFCGLPTQTHIPGLNVSLPTVFVIMVILQATAVALCFMGGQVTLIVTDFLQGVFVSIMFIAIVFVIYKLFSWNQVVEAYSAAPNGVALLHPFKSSDASNFDIKFFLIDAFWLIYNVISWSPGTMQAGSAKDAHEAKMMKVMGTVRQIAILGLGLYLLPYAAFVLMNHPDFAATAAKVNTMINGIDNPQIRSQMLVPAAVSQILPVGLIGAFTAVVMFAFIACHDVYLLAWGGILIQDIVIPLRGKPLEAKTHIWLLRLSVLASASFTVIWSMYFKQIDDIFMYFDITAGIYLSGAGVVILGGIYWKRGTTTAAWVAMITGSLLAGGGFIYKSYINPDFLNGRIMAFLSICISVTLFIVVSLLTKDPKFDLDAMLHRKPGQEYAATGKRKWWQFGPEFSKFDKFLYIIIVASVVAYFAVFAVVNFYNIKYDVPVSKWLSWWHVYFYLMFFGGSAFLVWITIGGIRDLVRMFRHLRQDRLDVTDDGRVDAEKFYAHGHGHAGGEVEKTASGTVSGTSKAILMLLGLGVSLTALAGCCCKGKDTGACVQVKHEIYTVKHATGPMTLDANWNKPDWQNIKELTLTNLMGEAPQFIPTVKAKMMYDDQNLYIIWKVDDKYVACRETKYNGKQWEDSCVEFFFTPNNDIKTGFFNLETSCSGKPLLRHQMANGVKIIYVPFEKGGQIKSASSMQAGPEEIRGPLTWYLEMQIPIDTLKQYTAVTRPGSGVTWRGNFYKCADATSNPHYLTWSRVNMSAPNFHVPRDFGILQFE